MPAGRHYGVGIAATDACGNRSAPVGVGGIYVPHDQSPHEKACLEATHVGCRPNEPVPCGRR